MFSKTLEIVGEPRGVEGRGVAHQRRPTGAALVVEHQRVPPGERCQIGGEVLHVEPRPAVDDDQRVASRRAHHSIEEAYTVP
jgi:hypothetical protein